MTTVLRSLLAQQRNCHRGEVWCSGKCKRCDRGRDWQHRNKVGR